MLSTMVILNELFGDSQHNRYMFAKAKDKVISNVALVDNVIEITFEDNSKLRIYDNGQSCCESRYITTDDTLGEFVGARLLNIETKEAPTPVNDNSYDRHDVEFLELVSDKRPLTFTTHVEHNGYYGGFSIVLQYIDGTKKEEIN